MENEEKLMISSYEVMQSIHIGKKEVVFGIDEKIGRASCRERV